MCTSYGLVQLADALAIAAGHAHLRSATFSRALEFLLDQALEDGFVGIHKLIAEEASATLAPEAQAVIAARLTELGGALAAARAALG